MPGREDADVLAAGAPSLSLNNGDAGHLSAGRTLKGTAPPAAGDEGARWGKPLQAQDWLWAAWPEGWTRPHSHRQTGL